MFPYVLMERRVSVRTKGGLAFIEVEDCVMGGSLRYGHWNFAELLLGDSSGSAGLSLLGPSSTRPGKKCQL